MGATPLSGCLSKVSTADEHLNANCANLFAMEVDALNDWYRKFEEKYPVVGKVKDSDFKPLKKTKKTKKHDNIF